MADKNEKKVTAAIVEKKGNTTVYKCGKNAGVNKPAPEKKSQTEGLRNE